MPSCATYHIPTTLKTEQATLIHQYLLSTAGIEIADVSARHINRNSVEIQCIYKMTGALGRLSTWAHSGIVVCPVQWGQLPRDSLATGRRTGNIEYYLSSSDHRLEDIRALVQGCIANIFNTTGHLSVAWTQRTPRRPRSLLSGLDVRASCSDRNLCLPWSILLFANHLWERGWIYFRKIFGACIRFCWSTRRSANLTSF